jgi:predicted GIY-YIG superfamily endonuclease
MRMWFVYILSSKNDGKQYVDLTNDLKRRLEKGLLLCSIPGKANHR